jgi:predicted acetyltransferase
MTVDVRLTGSVTEFRDALNAISHYFGNETSDEDAERFARWLEPERTHAAWDDGRIVGGAGAIDFELSVPGGGSVQAAGVTIVGVLPSHRRRGVLTAMMKEQLADCRARGDVAAYLWASEAKIYPRFGYGLASRIGALTLARDRAQFSEAFVPRGTVRIVSLEEAAETFPQVYDQVFAQRPGMFRRSKTWWETRRLYDDPERRRNGPLTRVLLELDGEPAGYALYRVAQDWQNGSSSGTVTIVEAVAPTPEGTRELWRWLFDFDWTSQFVADLLPLDHPLFLLLAEPRRMHFRLNDGVWVRLLDIEAALSARTYLGQGEIVLEITDAFLPELAGRYRVSPSGAERTEAAPDLRLDVTGLGSVYLGAFGFGHLVRALRAEELTDGAAHRADALFATGVEPWCAEIF